MSWLQKTLVDLPLSPDKLRRVAMLLHLMERRRFGTLVVSRRHTTKPNLAINTKKHQRRVAHCVSPLYCMATALPCRVRKASVRESLMPEGLISFPISTSRVLRSTSKRQATYVKRPRDGGHVVVRIRFRELRDPCIVYARLGDEQSILQFS